MKKFISIFAVLSILVSMFAIGVSAEEADIQFSVSDAKGTTGDTVKIDVSVDKNIGVYGMGFNTVYDSRCFELVSVTNGEVFTDQEYGIESPIDDSGKHWYYAETSDFYTNVTKTGVVVTFEFKILKSAPNGVFPITVDFGNRPGGWFFDANDSSNERTVEMTKAGSITVTGSTADPLPETTVTETDDGEEPSDSSSSGSSSGSVGDDTTGKINTYETEWVTEFVTDDEGEIVTDEAGEAVTTMVPIAIPNTPETTEADGTTQVPETEIVYVTDTDGETVTDEAGEPVTEIVIIENDGEDDSSVNTVVLVVCIVAAVVAVALIAVVIIIGKKKNDEE